MELILGIIGTIITSFAFAYAVYQDQTRRKLTAMTRNNLSVLAGNIEKTRESAALAWDKFQEIKNIVEKVEDTDLKNKIITCSQFGAGDSASAERMLQLLLNEAVGMQKSLCNTKEIRMPQQLIDEIHKQEYLGSE